MDNTAIEERVQLLRRVGAGLYGRQWQSALAADLAVNDRTMRRWVSGEWNIPGDAWRRLGDLIIERELVLADLRQELEERRNSLDTDAKRPTYGA